MKVCKLTTTGDVAVSHIPGIINPSDIFTEEMKDVAHYRCIWDTFMASLSNFTQFQSSLLFSSCTHTACVA